METASLPLAAGLSIDRMSDEEICRCLELGMLPTEVTFSSRIRTQTAEVALRLRHDEPLFIGDVAERDRQTASAHYAAMQDRLLTVLNGLRVFKAGRVSIPGILHFSEAWPMRG